MKNLDQLIQKYNRPGPRYTSYPPVPFWKGAPDEDTWLSHVAQHNNEGIDLYVHVPFCEKLCWYCGCNRTITKDHSVENELISILKKEWSIYQNAIKDLKINSLHFGGGTPTFLSPENLKELISCLTSNRSENFIGSIEVDPRTCTKEHLILLKEMGLSRISLGIQDFDPVVQKAINRYQPVSLVENLLKEIRSLEFESINFDLIYGLPKQSRESIVETINIVKKLDPDLIAFYGYAHLPHKIKNQKLINNEDLPSPALRQELYQTGKALLKENGLVDIGMDHFAKESNYLYQAKLNHALHRNFMGYTDRKSKCLIGLGPSAISDSGVRFAQNHKEYKDYKEIISRGKLAFDNGHIQTADDLLTQKHILTLMCEDEASISESIPYYQEIKKEMEDFQEDGLVVMEENKVTLTETGKIFMRNIAMSFDFHLRTQTSVRFSQTV